MVAFDPSNQWNLDDWSDVDFDSDGLPLPAEPQCRRCSAIHCVQEGPWIGTLACCTRQRGHENEHSMPLGDVGSAEYWKETWL
jgi:hypothetical protein